MPDAIQCLMDGRRAERLGILDRALEAYEAAASSTEDPDVISEALARQSAVYRSRCDWDLAVEHARRAGTIAHAAGLLERYAEACNAEALVHMSRGDFAAATPLLEEVVGRASDQRLRGIGLQNLGTIHAQQGRYDAADRAFAESHGCFHQCGYSRGEAIALNNRGRMSLLRRQWELAEEVLSRALEAARAEEDEELVALAMLNLAEAVLGRNEHVRAELLIASALGHFRSAHNLWRQVECLRLLGAVNERQGSRQDAAQCYEHALRLARDVGASVEIAELEDCLRRLPPANA